MNIYSIASNINQEAETIIDQLDEEPISVYVFLVNVFSMSDVTENQIFQFVYRSYYQIDPEVLNSKFHQNYFHLMQSYRFTDRSQHENIFEQVNLMNGDSTVFSLTTKLFNMIDPSYPIYNAHTEQVFPLLQNCMKNEHFIVQYHKLIDLYNQIIRQNLLNKTLNLFEQKFPIYELPLTKKLDFIFSAYGKLLNNKQIALT